MESTSKRRRKQAKTSLFESEEVNSIEWEFIDMTEPEEDLIYRMHRLIGDRPTGKDRIHLVVDPSSDSSFTIIVLPNEIVYVWVQFPYLRWDLIAGRIPGRKAEEIERFWIMKNNEVFAERRKLKKKEKSKNLS